MAEIHTLCELEPRVMERVESGMSAGQRIAPRKLVMRVLAERFEAEMRRGCEA